MKSAAQIRLVPISPSRIAFCIVLSVGLLGTALGQVGETIETASVESTVARQFALTAKDLRSLRPLMECESDRLLSLYGYYADQENPDFLSLWSAVRSRRTALADPPFDRLTQRQKKALSLARFEFETQILERWLDDHLQTLREILELDWVQFKYVQKVFETEHRKRLDILREERTRPVRLDTDWRILTDEREREMEQILTGSQLRAYHQVTRPPRLIAMR